MKMVMNSARNPRKTNDFQYDLAMALMRVTPFFADF